MKQQESLEIQMIFRKKPNINKNGIKLSEICEVIPAKKPMIGCFNPLKDAYFAIKLSTIKFLIF